MRAGGTDLAEPGQATFKIGNEAGGVDREITGRDGEPVSGNDFKVAGVGVQIIFDDQHGLDFGPANKQT